MNKTISLFVALLALTFTRSARAGTEQAVAESKPLLIDQAPPEMKEVTSRLWAVVFSPDGQTLAVTAGWDNPREPGELVIWDVASRRPKLIWRQESPIRSAAFSSDGKLVAIGDFAGVTRFLDPTTAKSSSLFPSISRW